MLKRARNLEERSLMGVDVWIWEPGSAAAAAGVVVVVVEGCLRFCDIAPKRRILG